MNVGSRIKFKRKSINHLKENIVPDIFNNKFNYLIIKINFFKNNIIVG